ncbi:MAG: Nramp family divalent metal transporter [Chloroflexi bacterium]|nr:Nramp family divalent metal transporter [Chloroflexota bacterium]
MRPGLDPHLRPWLRAAARRRAQTRKLIARRRRPPRWLLLLGALGPGFIAANAGNDAGAIATHAVAGASYGYRLLWVMVVLTVPLFLVQEMCARMGAVTGKGLADLIRERFGVRWTTVAMLTLLLANTGTAISEFAGIAAAAELFGLQKLIVVPLLGVMLWVLIVRGSYQRVERGFLVMTMVFFAYPLAAVLARPDWGEVGRNLVSFPVELFSGYLFLVVALIGTTITPYMQFFVQTTVVDKGVSTHQLSEERLDVAVGSFFANVIVLSIQIATAAALFGRGEALESAADAARALTPVAGEYAGVLFGVGLVGASLLAAGVLPLSTSFAICEAFGLERGISRSWQEAPVFYGLFTGILALAVLVTLLPIDPLALLLVVQVANGLLLPVILVFITRLASDQELLGPYANGRLSSLLAWGTTLVISALALTFLVVSFVLPLFGGTAAS